MSELQGDLRGRRALVVGGSGGIGAQLSLALAARGASLLVHGGSDAGKLDSLVEKLRVQGCEARGFLRRIEASSDAVESFVREVGTLGPIDILVLAFGPFLRASLSQTSSADWQGLTLLNLALPGALASYFLPLMQARGWGRVLFLGGTRTDSIRAFRGNAAYAAAKTALGVLNKSLAAEGAAGGVASLLVCPGLVETEYLSDEERERQLKAAPRGRLLDPAALAEASIALLAQEPCLASGAVLSLDAGLEFQAS